MSFFPELADPGDEAEDEYRRDWTGPPPGLSGGGGLETRHGYWLWPAPLAGDLQIVAQWLEQGIAECRVTIPAPLLADAARRIVEVWPDDVLGGPA